MAYESFYGGRQGTSFIIKKNYLSVQDMVDEFQKGGVTLREVNYGEYVMISPTNKNSSENGMIFRRGMELGNRYGGGIYIGQIRGPEGKIKNLEIGDYDPTATDPQGGHEEYTPTTGGLVPGKGQEKEGEWVQNNSIKYSQVNLLDSEGYIQKYLIGFQFPYFQQEQKIKLIEPEDIPANLIEDITPLVDDPESGHAEWTDRPFYRKYELSVPKGVKGDSIVGAAGIPTIVNADGIDSCLYNSVNETTHELGNPDPLLTEPYPLDCKKFIDYKETIYYGYIKFTDANDNIKYAYLRNTSNEFQHHGFLTEKFDNESTQFKKEQMDGGISSYIADIQISDGSGGGDNFREKDYLLVYYSDPVMRAAIPPANRVMYKDKNGQLKLGRVKGDPGTCPIMGFVDSLDELYQDGPTREQAKTPEQVGGEPRFAGQVVALNSEDINKEIYAYSYIGDHDQYLLGVQSGGGGGGFIIDEEPPAKLTVDGIQGQLETIITVDRLTDPGI